MRGELAGQLSDDLRLIEFRRDIPTLIGIGPVIIEFPGDQLAAFEANQGHTLVPRDHPQGLGIWVKNMRFQRTKNKVKPDVIATLDAMNFVWVAPKGPDKEKVIEWGKHFKWVANFAKAKGHCRVPATIGGKAVPAAAWCEEQRRLYVEDKLGADATAKLEKIGFDFYGSDDIDATPATAKEEPVSC